MSAMDDEREAPLRRCYLIYGLAPESLVPFARASSRYCAVRSGNSLESAAMLLLGPLFVTTGQAIGLDPLPLGLMIVVNL